MLYTIGIAIVFLLYDCYFNIKHSRLNNQEIDQLNRKLEVQRKKYGSDHKQIAGLIYKLANLHKNEKNHELAKLLYEQALEIYQKNCGVESFEVGKTLNSFAILYKGANWENSDNEAETLFKQSISIHKANANSRYLQVTLKNLGDLYVKLGHHELAELYYLKAIEIFGKKDSYTIRGILQKLCEARLFRRASQLREEYLGRHFVPIIFSYYYRKLKDNPHFVSLFAVFIELLVKSFK